MKIKIKLKLHTECVVYVASLFCTFPCFAGFAQGFAYNNLSQYAQTSKTKPNTREGDIFAIWNRHPANPENPFCKQRSSLSRLFLAGRKKLLCTIISLSREKITLNQPSDRAPSRGIFRRFHLPIGPAGCAIRTWHSKQNRWTVRRRRRR